MRLNYTPSTIQQQPVETQIEDVGYFTPKTSDKYSTFIGMQQVANAALGKSGNINERLQDVNPLQPANRGDRYDV